MLLKFCKTKLFLVIGVFLGAPTFGAAQPLAAGLDDDDVVIEGGGGVGWPYYRPATAFESYMRGLSDLFRAGGEFQFLNSIAANNYAEAYRREIDNRYKNTRAFFEVQELNRQLRRRADGVHTTAEQRVRYAQTEAPAEMTPQMLDRATGTIFWPLLLQQESFKAQRQLIDQIFANRALSGGRVPAEDFVIFDQSIAEMHAILKQIVRETPPGVYVEAREFLDSLAREGGA